MTHDPTPIMAVISRRIGIIGGTFDPVHIGHLIIAEESRCRLDLEKVVFIPAGQPPHKPSEPIASAEHRYAMTVLATRDNPAFEVSRIEMERPGPSYTVDTIEELRSTCRDEVEFFFIVGADSLLEILTWHQPERLINLCRIVAATRPGYDQAEAERLLPRAYLERTVFLDAPSVDISSTELRERVASGTPIRYLVPRDVEEYILKNGLYGREK